jgi:SAM-dependent methyltransferase
MASDWRLLATPLRRHACLACGLLATRTQFSSGLFEDHYALYAHSPTDVRRERERQRAYARWILDACHRAGKTAQPRFVLDVGCGNGSLLLALKAHWPSATLIGCDPSAEAVAHAAGAGCTIWQGTASSVPSRVQADVVVSVNVIEHTDDPLAFLRNLRGGLTDDGTLVLICPDGGKPGVELLIADHVHSFAARHLCSLLERAGLAPRDVEQAPTALGSFQLIIAGTAQAAPEALSPLTTVDVSACRSYLQQWSALDAQLLSRIGDGGVSCFGIGEAAGLLRAYTPRTWQRVRSCTADEVRPSSRFGSLPAVPLEQISADATLLLAVRPQDQPGLAARLSSRFARVISWHDLIEV